MLVDSDICYQHRSTYAVMLVAAEGGQFEMLIYVGKGRGFVPADGNKT